MNQNEHTFAPEFAQKLVRDSQALNRVAYRAAEALGYVTSPAPFRGDPLDLIDELLDSLSQAESSVRQLEAELRIAEGKVKDREDDIVMWRNRCELAEALLVHAQSELETILAEARRDIPQQICVNPAITKTKGA